MIKYTLDHKMAQPQLVCINPSSHVIHYFHVRLWLQSRLKGIALGTWYSWLAKIGRIPWACLTSIAFCMKLADHIPSCRDRYSRLLLRKFETFSSLCQKLGVKPIIVLSSLVN